MVYSLTDRLFFPDPASACVHPAGLLAVGGDLSVPRLLLAYRHGIFPWYAEHEPILWWSPDPRMVLNPNEFHGSRSLQKTARGGQFEWRVDTAFEQVLKACAAPRAGASGTWILPEMVHAYGALFTLGYAHSFEIWREQQLVGGLYGVLMGRLFFAESMFSAVPNASKLALLWLCQWATHFGIDRIDCQMYSAHLATLGARLIPRVDFLAQLAVAVNSPFSPGRWVHPLPFPSR